MIVNVASGPMLGVHCKLICSNCGYREDCSDIFPVDPNSDEHARANASTLRANDR
jgi:hypothetical protein